MFSQGKSNSRAILTAYFGTETFTVKKQQTDKESRILIIDIFNNNSEYILINLYHANSEKQSKSINWATCLNYWKSLIQSKKAVTYVGGLVLESWKGFKSQSVVCVV